MNASKALSYLSRFDLDALAEGLRSWDDATEAAISEAIADVQSLIDRMGNLIETVDDAEEIATLIAINYIELKTRWIALNTRINYSLFKHGSCETSDALNASAVSGLIGHLENMLSNEDIETITDFLSRPLNRAA
jgi:hypothetical protein